MFAERMIENFGTIFEIVLLNLTMTLIYPVLLILALSALSFKVLYMFFMIT